MSANNPILLNVHAVDAAAISTDNLVAAARAGSPEAFTKLHAIYSRRLYKTILAITKSPEDAEDALQDTFLRAYSAFRSFEGRSHVYSWLTRIAINSALMVLRKRRTCPEILFDPQPDSDPDAIASTLSDNSPSPEEVSDHRERRTKVLFAIRKLSPPLREPIRMQMTQGLSVKEIGHALDLTDAAVKARLYRARIRLCAVPDFKPFSVHRQ